LRRRRRSPPATGIGGGRRLTFLPARDAISDTGLLYLHVQFARAHPFAEAEGEGEEGGAGAGLKSILTAANERELRESVNVSEIFIRRPIATSLLMLGIALFGVVAYRALPVAELPTVDFPTLSVTATLPGADPETMASAVATPLERQFSAIAGLDSM